MPINFPNSPAVNDTYTFSGRTWQWNGNGWFLTSQSIGSLGYTGSIGYTGSAGYVGSASTTAGPTGYTGSKGDTGP